MGGSSSVEPSAVQHVQPGIFVQPTGAQLRSAPDETALSSVWEEVGACYGYAKPDGWRIQIHKQGDEINLFSRSGADWSTTFSSVAELIRTHVKYDQVILDAELVGFDHNGYHVSPSDLRNAPQYRCILLDALYLNNHDITTLPTRKRFELMWEYLRDMWWGEALVFANYTPICSEEELRSFYRECRRRRHEGFDGAIIKRLDAPYFTDALKIKPSDTIDAVVIGAYLNSEGEPKHLLLAVPSHEHKLWKPIAKITGKGTQWDAVWSACQPYLSNRRPLNLDYIPHKPHIWIIPEVVVTAQITELQLGKKYPVYADAARGCVLREEKGPQEATSFELAYQIACAAALHQNGATAQKSL